ncbi:MAG: UbiA family prenyltransferase, partial [Acidimicrobiia bacterium]
LWTPAHFWALAMRYKDDYEAAGIPMLPVLIGDRRTSVQIIVYAVLTLAATVALWPVASMGMLYGVTAVVLGVMFVLEAIRLFSSPDRAMGLFIYSTIYLTILSGAMVADVFLR